MNLKSKMDTLVRESAAPFDAEAQYGVPDLVCPFARLAGGGKRIRTLGPLSRGSDFFSRTRRAGDRLVPATGLRLTRTAPMEERIGQQLPASLALLLVIPAEMLADRRTIELDPENETVG